MEKKPCRRCLLEALSDEALSMTVKRTIEAIPEEERITEEEYRKRLSLCCGCDELLSGMCVKCGCFAEVRAAYKKRHCPLVHPLW